MAPERREAVGFLKEEHELSERRTCEAVKLSRRAFRYVPQARDDTALIEALSRLAREHADQFSNTPILRFEM